MSHECVVLQDKKAVGGLFSYRHAMRAGSLHVEPSGSTFTRRFLQPGMLLFYEYLTSCRKFGIRMRQQPASGNKGETS